MTPKSGLIGPGIRGGLCPPLYSDHSVERPARGSLPLDDVGHFRTPYAVSLQELPAQLVTQLPGVILFIQLNFQLEVDVGALHDPDDTMKLSNEFSAKSAKREGRAVSAQE